METKQTRWLFRLLTIVLAFVALLLFLKLKPYWLPVAKIIEIITIPFIFSLFISFLISPLITYTDRFNLPRWLSIILLYILFFGGIGFLIYKGIPVIIDQLSELSSYLPQLLSNYHDLVFEIHNETSNLPLNLQDKLQDLIMKMEVGVNKLLAGSMNFLKTLLNSLLIIGIIPIIVFYFLKDREELKESFYSALPRKTRKETRLFLNELTKTLGGYIRGQILVGLLIGTLAAVLLSLFGMKYAILLGIVIGITNIIPYFGPILGAIPAVIIAITMSFKMVIVVLVIIFSLQFLEGNIVSPYIIGKNIAIHPVWIIFALISGSELGGLVGMIISVPILVIVKVTYSHIRKHFSSLR